MSDAHEPNSVFQVSDGWIPREGFHQPNANLHEGHSHNLRHFFKTDISNIFYLRQNI